MACTWTIKCKPVFVRTHKQALFKFWDKSHEFQKDIIRMWQPLHKTSCWGSSRQPKEFNKFYSRYLIRFIILKLLAHVPVPFTECSNYRWTLIRGISVSKLPQKLSLSHETTIGENRPFPLKVFINELGKKQAHITSGCTLRRNVPEPGDFYS